MSQRCVRLLQLLGITCMQRLVTAALAALTVFSTPLTGSAAAQAQTPERVLPLAAYTEAVSNLAVSFLAHDLETGQRFVLEGSDLDTGYVPWSTFKIPNLLMALESGFTPDLETPLAWDQARRPAQPWWPDAWRQDQSLRTAFQRSAAWYFQDVALHVGAPAYRQTLGDWAYGNAVAPDGSDTFWLAGGLEISVSQQVRFLERVVRQNLAVSPSAHEALMEASLAQQEDGHALHGKTGAGPSLSGDFSGPFEGWYVGFVQRREAAPIVFALHAAGPDWPSIRTFRQDFAVRLLVDAELLPASFAN